MKFMIVSLLLVCTVATACPRPGMQEAAMFDTATTALGIHLHPTALELNPLGAIGASIVRTVLVLNENLLTPDQRNTATAVWVAAGVHNLVHILGAAFAPALMMGTMVGIWVLDYNNNNCLEGEQHDRQ